MKIMDVVCLRKFSLKLSIVLAVAIILSTAISSLATADETHEYVLVTGFEPFGGDKTNGSWEAVRHLQGKRFSHKTVVVFQLPVVWGEAENEIHRLIEQYHPVAVIAFGQAGAGPVKIEMVAHNVRQSIPDNRGALPRQLLISKTAPLTLKTTLNVDAILKHLHEAGIPAIESNDAGGYLCNNIFFALMTNPGAKYALNIPRGFVHVPPLNSSVATSDDGNILFDKRVLELVADIVAETVADSLSLK